MHSMQKSTRYWTGGMYSHVQNTATTHCAILQVIISDMQHVNGIGRVTGFTHMYCDTWK
jgi:hypothetical protein